MRIIKQNALPSKKKKKISYETWWWPEFHSSLSNLIEMRNGFFDFESIFEPFLSLIDLNLANYGVFRIKKFLMENLFYYFIISFIKILIKVMLYAFTNKQSDEMIKFANPRYLPICSVKIENSFECNENMIAAEQLWNEEKRKKGRKHWECGNE